jgi:hypothetical protein
MSRKLENILEGGGEKDIRESDVQMYRNMWKSPDVYPDDPVEKAEVREMLKKEEEERNKEGIEEQVEIKTLDGQAFKEAVDLVFSASLLPEFQDNKDEGKIVEQRRQSVITFLGNILEDARNYLTQVNHLQLQKATTYESAEKYKDAVGHSDNLRRNYHNKLIQDVKIAMRLININFNADFPEELRLREEAKMPDRQGVDAGKLKELMKQRKYFHFPYPAGAFIDFRNAPKDPESERKFIAFWALKIYEDLTILADEIQNKKGS